MSAARALIAPATLLFGALPALAGTPVQLRAIELQSQPGGATLTLNLSGPVRPHLMRLHSPERLVVDLPATVRHAPLPEAGTDGVVSAMRSGVHEDHTLRLVLELKRAMAARLLPMNTADAYRWRVAIGTAPVLTATIKRQVLMPAAAVAAAASVAEPPSLRSASAPDTEPLPAPSPMQHSVRAAHAPHGEHDIIVAVDAGHGGDDPGATGADGTHEKDVTLAIARALAARIDEQPGMHAVLTRSGDYFVELRRRMERASAAHADMFVSIHADAVRDREVTGASVYILSERGASSEAAKKLAEQQNAVDLKGGISLADQAPGVRSILLDVAQKESIGDSVEAADRVLTALDRVGAVRKREVQQAAFVVLKSPDIPSMLVETAYISNPAEERKLRTPEQQQQLAQAIFSGIDAYFRKHPPEGSRYAREPEATQPGVELARTSP